MRKIILIAVFLLLAWPSLAQSSRTGTYTSYDGVIQVDYMRGWRIGAIEPDLGDFELDSQVREAPQAYYFNLLHSNPDAEIRFLATDAFDLFPEDENQLEFLQENVEEAFPDVEITSLMLGETEALELHFTESSIAELALNLGEGRLELVGARRLILWIGRNNWLIAALLFAEDEVVDEEFITIASSFRFNGSSRNLISLSGGISLELPDEWFRTADVVETGEEREVIQVKNFTMQELCIAHIEIIALDSPEFSFPEDGSNDDYLEAYLNDRDIEYEPLDIYAEHLAEGVSLYMTETEADYQYLSVQVLEENLVLGMTYLGEGYCIDDYFLIINSVREE